MQLLTDILLNSTLIELEFKDVIRNTTREGIVSFQAPVYYHFRVKDIYREGIMNKLLHVLCVPVNPGRCRVHLALDFRPNQHGERRRSIPSWVPLWFIHSRSNNFLDSDIWIHDQELNVRSQKGTLKYVTPSESDKGVIFFRKWYDKHFSKSVIFGPSSIKDLQEMSKSSQLDRWNDHTKHCKQCLYALKKARWYKKISLPVVLVLFSIFSLDIRFFNIKKGLMRLVLKAFTIAGYILTQRICSMVERGTIGPDKYEDEKTTAAQFSR